MVGSAGLLACIGPWRMLHSPGENRVVFQCSLGRPAEAGEGQMETFPKCRACSQGDLIPLSDFGSQGAAIHYKAWVCTNPECGFNIKIRNGDVYLNEPIANGSVHTPRYR